MLPVFPGKKNPVYPEEFRNNRHSINGIKFIERGVIPILALLLNQFRQVNPQRGFHIPS